MRLRRSLVLVAHDDPGVRVAQAADLTGAGYRCLTAGDSDAAIWFAVKFSRLALRAVRTGTAADGDLDRSVRAEGWPDRSGWTCQLDAERAALPDARASSGLDFRARHGHGVR